MAAKIRKNDLVEVVRGRTSDEKALAKRNARRAEEGLEPLKPGDKGKQGRVIQVFPAEGKVLVEGINLKTRHVRQGQQGRRWRHRDHRGPHLAVQGRSGRPPRPRSASASVSARTPLSAAAAPAPSESAWLVVARSAALSRARRSEHGPASEGKVRLRDPRGAPC